MKILNHKTLFVTGIDTDAGKTYATAWLANILAKDGRKVVTQKFIQTGCDGFSEDILRHRELMGIEPLPEDRNLLTSPIILHYPASAQLAAKLDGVEIDLSKVQEATKVLESRYDHVLIEGAGGLMVPITDDYFTIDYISEHKHPVVLVTNGVLGSINHTILSLEAIASRNLILAAVVYNHHFDSDEIISQDTLEFIRRYLANKFPETEFIEIPHID